MSRILFFCCVFFLLMASPGVRSFGVDRAYADALPSAAAVDIVLDHVQFPTNLAFAPDGRIFYTELSGGIRIVENGRLQSEPFFSDPNLVTDDETGMLGLALDPDFATNHFVYVFYTYYPGLRGDGEPVLGRILRLRDDSGAGKDPTTLLDDIPGVKNAANGGKIAIGPDKKLYASIGSLESPDDVSQTPGVLNGKILRLNLDGSIPDDNPFPHSPVFAYGFRNVYGLAFDQKTGELWVTDNGPDCDDKLLMVEAGKNYGFSIFNTCGHQVPGSVQPVHIWEQTIGITGLAFVCNPELPQLRDWLAIGDTNIGALIALHFSADHRVVDREDTFFSVPDGDIIVDVTSAPNGDLYFTTQSAIYRMHATTAEQGKHSPASRALLQPFRLFVPAGGSAGTPETC